MNWRLVFAGILLWPTLAEAVELRHIDVVTGTAGLAHVPIDVRNTGATPLSCTIQLAHWYSMSLGEALPGGRTVIDLWFDPVNGTYLILNEALENMPVEALWCAIAGRAYQSRAPIALNRSAGAVPKPRELTCAAPDERLICK